ncbi:MAG: transglycosylase SLT domain-containing protein [Rhizobiaceae bacterium]
MIVPVRLSSMALLGLMLAAAPGPAFPLDKLTTGSVGAQAGSKKSQIANVAPASSTLKRGLNALRKGRVTEALKAREALRPGTLERKLMAWAIAVHGRGVDAHTLTAIANDLPDWPKAKTIRINIERALVKTMSGPGIRAAFSQSQPESMDAAIALARAHMAAGDAPAARKAIAPVWRKNVLSISQERKLLADFGSVLTRANHRSRIEFLLSKKRLRAAARIAGKAGMTRLVAARAAVERMQRSAKSALDAVPASQRGSANYLFSKAKHLRRKNQLTAAAKALRTIDLNSIDPAANDAIWVEQRILVNDLIEAGSPKTAYSVASRNTALSPVKRMDAEFYAGWIALRKLKAPGSAISHFQRLLTLAQTPLSRSRGHYWLGRAHFANGQRGDAKHHFANAAKFDTTFYGQLAAARVGRSAINVLKASPTGSDRARFPKYELVQAIYKLESAGHETLARPFYRFLARHLDRPGELALLAARAERQGDYRLSLQVGKRAHYRGFSADTLAWPLGAIPRNTKTSGAGLPLAYAIARQESAFQIDARSSANALGLLQLLPGTAKSTARSIGIGYSRSRLVRDASYNARLGTAFLSQQMQNFGGSFVLTFAAYNAGPRRALDWVNRFGDPRGKSVETVVDWIEQIPFGETRNYVMRVMENYQVYKKRLKGGKLTIERDLSAGRRG